MSNARELGRLVENTVAYDRAKAIRVLRRHGVKREVVAEAFGISPARVSQITRADAAPGGLTPPPAG